MKQSWRVEGDLCCPLKDHTHRFISRFNTGLTRVSISAYAYLIVPLSFCNLSLARLASASGPTSRTFTVIN